MPTLTERGAPLMIQHGVSVYPNYPYPGSCTYIGIPVSNPSGRYVWERTTERSTAVKRKKPVGIDALRNLTDWNWSETTRQVAKTTYPGGNSAIAQRQGSSYPIALLNEALEKARVRSVNNLLQNVKAEVWNLSTFLGELPETWEYVSKVYSGLIKSYNAVKRGDMRKLRNMSFPLRNGKTYHGRRWSRSVKGRDISLTSQRGGRDYGGSVVDNVGSRWMEWRFAVMPMIYDLEDALKYLASSGSRVLISHSEGRGKEQLQADYVDSVATTSYSGRVAVKSGMYYQVNPAVQSFKELGLTNPVATLYELLPLSFVLDYFYDLGTFVGNLDAMAGTSEISRYQVVKTSRQCTVQEKSIASLCGLMWSSAGTLNEKTYGRSRQASFSIPPPSFTVGLKARQFLDVTVLLRQAIR